MDSHHSLNNKKLSGTTQASTTGHVKSLKKQCNVCHKIICLEYWHSIGNTPDLPPNLHPVKNRKKRKKKKKKKKKKIINVSNQVRAL
jgi:hypothetical protein